MLSLDVDGEYAKARGIVAEDIHEGKRTLMVLRTLNDESFSNEKKERLLTILNMKTKDEQLLREAVSILHESGSIEYAKNKASEIVKVAWEELDPLL